MSERNNLQTVRRIGEAVSEGDLLRILSLCTDDLRFVPALSDKIAWAHPCAVAKKPTMVEECPSFTAEGAAVMRAIHSRPGEKASAAIAYSGWLRRARNNASESRLAPMS